MIARNPLGRLLRYALVAGVLACGLGELARLQGWRLRARFRHAGRDAAA
jgi:hypothetical protein